MMLRSTEAHPTLQYFGHTRGPGAANNTSIKYSRSAKRVYSTDDLFDSSHVICINEVEKLQTRERGQCG